MSEPLDLDAIERQIQGWWPTSAIGVAYQLKDEVTRLRAELDAEREGHREQRAAAWDEGYAALKDYQSDWRVATAVNPYREPTP